MGLFSSKETPLSIISPGLVEVNAEVRSVIPDAGDVLLGVVGEAQQEVVKSEIRRVRHANGGLPGELRQGIPFKASSGPIYLLQWICAGDYITVEVWASLGLRGREAKEVSKIAGQIVNAQGIPAAATWVMRTRMSAPPRVETLAEMLSDTYSNNLGTMTNAMLIDSFKKWKRS